METIIDRVAASLYEPNRWHARPFFTDYGYTLHDPKTGTSIQVVASQFSSLPPNLLMDGYKIQLTLVQKGTLEKAVSDWRRYYRVLTHQGQVAKMDARWQSENSDDTETGAGIR